MVSGALVAVAAITGCGSGSEAEGTWRFVSLERGGRVLLSDEPLFLEVSDGELRADTTCNTVSGELGGQLETTLMACPGAAADHERLMVEAFGTEPSADGDRLVFDFGDVRLVYAAYDEPTPAALVAVLGDPAADVDESALPPEAATGSVPPDFEALVPVPSPTDDVYLFLAELDGNVCVVYGTSDAMDKWCVAPRLAERWATAVGIPIYGAPLFRVVLVPDAFADAATKRTDLGAYAANLLVLHDDAPSGTHVLTSDAGSTLKLTVPGP